MITFNAFFIQAMVAFTLCFFGERATMKPPELIQAAYNSEWYRWPTVYQQGIKMMILSGQREYFFGGYDIFNCTLSTF